MTENSERSPSKGSREDRIRKLLKEKKDFLENDLPLAREYRQKNLEAVRSGVGWGLFRPNLDEVARLKKATESFKELISLCDGVQNSEDPISLLRTMLEILFQKDDEWASAEGGNDLRLMIFYVYFQQKSGVFSSSKKVLNQLRERRFEKGFLEDVATNLAEVKNLFTRTLSGLENSLERQVEYNQKAPDLLSKVEGETKENLDRVEEKIRITKRHVVRLSEMLQEELKKQ